MKKINLYDVAAVAVISFGLYLMAGFIFEYVHHDCQPIFTGDLNSDGEVTFQDFSISLYQLDYIMNELDSGADISI